MPGATVREFSSKENKYCFEIVAQGKKGLKKYSFLCDVGGIYCNFIYLGCLAPPPYIGDRKLWVDQLKRVSKAGAMAAQIDGENPTDNPIREPSESGGSPGLSEEEMYGSEMSFLRKSSVKAPPPGIEGYLLKKSPALMSGWQKRYFVVTNPGEINYYGTVCIGLYFYLYSCLTPLIL